MNFLCQEVSYFVPGSPLLFPPFDTCSWTTSMPKRAEQSPCLVSLYEGLT